MAFTNRKFGIEIEACGLSFDEAEDAVTNAGFPCRFVNHGTIVNGWKIVEDGSVEDDNGEGFEVVSPVLSGDDGISQVRKVAKALVAAGAKVNRSCGLHVHVDANDLTTADIVNSVKRYAAHESVIDGFMPKSRRGDNNDFARPVSGIIPTLVRHSAAGASVRSLCEVIYERYYKLNVAAYLRHGTMEFRQHSGTVSGKKMENWIKFCVNFIESSKASVGTTDPGLFTGLTPEVIAYFEARTAEMVQAANTTSQRLTG